MTKLLSTVLGILFLCGTAEASDLKAYQVKTNTSAFNGALSSSDDTVQDALDTLDNAVAGGAPLSATYITQTANGTLSNEQALGSLATGIVKNTTTTGVLSIAAAGTDYLAPGAIGSTVQAYDADLTTYAGITPSANVQTLLGSADFAAFRTSLSLVIGTNVQAYDADLTTYAGITPSANIQSLLGSADYSAARTNLGLAIGTDVQGILSNSAGLRGALSDENGTGSALFDGATSPTFVTPVLGAATGTSLSLSGALGQIGGSTGATLSAAMGVVTLGGIGNTNNENITINFEGTANRAIINSGTGASIRSDIQFITATDIGHFFGTTSSVGKIMTTATGNDSLQIGTLVNSSTGSGVIGIMEQADMANANRSPSSVVTNPTLRIYSADATSATQYVDISHNQTDSVIDSGSGDISFLDNIKTSGTITSSRTTDVGMSVVTGANTACNTTCTSACVVGFDVGTLGVALAHIVACTDATADECLCAGGS